MSARPTFAIRLNRLPRVDESPGLISLLIDDSDKAEAPTTIGTLTDAALRGRLSHFGAHSANEIAAIRKALSIESGKTIVYESWAELGGCLQFWHGFIGSQIRLIEWTCASCAEPARDNIGGTVGESFPRRCRCGEITRVTVPK